tara:strand:+ start:118 stop:1836 length:1719 start_codon:yes stop_codon:yes gene_type:complete
MKIALAQINPKVGDLHGNSEKILNACRQAAIQKAELVLTPELSLWGYPPKDLLLSEDIQREQSFLINKISEAIKNENLNLDLLIGIAEKVKDYDYPNLFNSIAKLNKDGWEIIARKKLLPNYDVFDESRYFRISEYTGWSVFYNTKKSSSVGITICEDLWVDHQSQNYKVSGSDPIEDLKEKNIDLLINLSASPYTLDKDRTRKNIAKKAAQRLKCPVIYLNQVGANDELIFDGGSFILNSSGNLIFSLEYFKEQIAIWDSNKDNKITTKIKIIKEEEKIFKALTLGVKDYIRKCNFSSVIIGLSGGIDSALVATIAVAAVGKEQVKCILMPSPWSSKSSITDAKYLANRLNISSEIIPIEGIMKSFDDTFNNNMCITIDGLSAENLQSRIRGTILMAYANKEGHLLLSTGNKSELAVGYCTLYGDMNGGLSVIGDLYKTSVFKLSDWIDSKDSYECRNVLDLPTNGEIMSSAIRNKLPSAELKPNQLDSDSLPKYEVLDPILKALIEQNRDIEDLIKSGFDPKLVSEIQILLKKAEFKRHQAPPLLKISKQAFGSGWRKPIASGEHENPDA